MDSPFPRDVPAEEVEEVMIAGRWIKVRPGSFKEGIDTTSFLSPEGTPYSTQTKFVQLKRGRPNG